MIRLFINGLAASAGGGLTYLRNLIPHLVQRNDAEAIVLLSPSLCGEFDELPNIVFLAPGGACNTAQRFFYEQAMLPKLIRKHDADVLLSTGNFALWSSPVPQILLSRNSLYTSKEFFRDVRARRDYTIWADTQLKGWFARQSIRRADITIAPSEAFARDLSRWSGAPVTAVHHGFDAKVFTEDTTPLPVKMQAELNAGWDALRLLFVSHYNYYRNFETLLRAIPILKERLRSKKVKLYLTCRLSTFDNPGKYQAESASALVNHLRSVSEIIELGTVPYRSLHLLYRACQIYVTPAYAESFAHPLVEAMFSGLPIVASDLPVHRETCGNAAIYFSCFSPESLAESVLRVFEKPNLAEELSQAGRARAQDFSWEDHVSRLLECATRLANRSSNPK